MLHSILWCEPKGDVWRAAAGSVNLEEYAAYQHSSSLTYAACQQSSSQQSCSGSPCHHLKKACTHEDSSNVLICS